MAKNRKLTKNELLKVLGLLKVPLPANQTGDTLFMTVMETIKKPPPPPPPGP
jgi:hypothetical protein